MGRKKTFLIGVVIMTIGAILQICAFSVPQMIVARLITGMLLFFSRFIRTDLNFELDLRFWKWVSPAVK